MNDKVVYHRIKETFVLVVFEQTRAAFTTIYDACFFGYPVLALMFNSVEQSSGK